MEFDLHCNPFPSVNYNHTDNIVMLRSSPCQLLRTGIYPASGKRLNICSYLAREYNSQTSSESNDHRSPAGVQKESGSSPHSTDQSQASAANSPGQILKAILPLSPAVSRILHELGVKDSTKIKGTGLRGRLTKGDVLTHFKKASSPNGTAQKMIQDDADARLAERSKLGSSATSKAIEVQELPPLDASAIRLYITEGLSGLTHRPSTALTTSSFDSLLDDYSLPSSVARSTRSEPVISLEQSSDKYFEGFV